MRIGIDIDDTIAETYEVLFNYAQEYTFSCLKREPKVKNIDCKVHKYVETIHEWNEEESNEFWKLYYEKMLREVKVKTYAVKYLKKLKEEGNEIIFITARFNHSDFNLDVENITKNWFLQNDIPYDKLIINANEKQKIALEEKIDVFFDDSVRNCKAVSEVGIKTYVMDSKVNKDTDIENVERVYSWPHAYMKINENVS